jgi:transcriptional regulator with XRE-family HTH domain
MSGSPIQVAFGIRVRELRKAKGYSQEAFAGRANLDRGAYGKIERGDINVGLITMTRIATALELTLSQLLATLELQPEEVRSLPRSRRGPRPIGGHKD